MCFVRQQTDGSVNEQRDGSESRISLGLVVLTATFFCFSEKAVHGMYGYVKPVKLSCKQQGCGNNEGSGFFSHDNLLRHEKAFHGMHGHLELSCS